MPDWLFLWVPIAIISIIAVFFGIRRFIHLARSGDDVPGKNMGEEFPHGDVIHVPFGATPRPLVDPFHDEVQ